MKQINSISDEDIVTSKAISNELVSNLRELYQIKLKPKKLKHVQRIKPKQLSKLAKSPDALVYCIYEGTESLENYQQGMRLLYEDIEYVKYYEVIRDDGCQLTCIDKSYNYSVSISNETDHQLLNKFEVFKFLFRNP